MWPGERFGHRPFLERAWELRGNVRSWDAMYVALAEAFGATLVTLDARLARLARLARVGGLACRVDVVA